MALEQRNFHKNFAAQTKSMARQCLVEGTKCIPNIVRGLLACLALFVRVVRARCDDLKPSVQIVDSFGQTEFLLMPLRPTCASDCSSLVFLWFDMLTASTQLAQNHGCDSSLPWHTTCRFDMLLAFFALLDLSPDFPVVGGPQLFCDAAPKLLCQMCKSKRY